MRSMSAGLAASTETPGSTPPDASRTVPAMPLACWADAVVAMSDTPTTRNISRCMELPLSESEYGVRPDSHQHCRRVSRVVTVLRLGNELFTVRGARRAQHVLQSEVSFVARVFVDETVDAIPRHLHRPRPRPRLGIGNGELVVDRPVARAREAL